MKSLYPTVEESLPDRWKIFTRPFSIYVPDRLIFLCLSHSLFDVLAPPLPPLPPCSVSMPPTFVSYRRTRQQLRHVQRRGQLCRGNGTQHGRKEHIHPYAGLGSRHGAGMCTVCVNWCCSLLLLIGVLLCFVLLYIRAVSAS